MTSFGIPSKAMESRLSASAREILHQKERKLRKHHRTPRRCICQLGDACHGMSAAFAVMKDPRGEFVELLHEEPDRPRSRWNQLRAAYLRHLCPDVTVPRSSSEDDGSDFVAVHHFHPRIIERFFDMSEDRKRREDEPFPAPARTMSAEDRNYFHLPMDEDQVVDPQNGNVRQNEYLVVPCYSFEAAHQDLKRSMRHHLRKMELIERMKRKQQDARRRELEDVFQSSRKIKEKMDSAEKNRKLMKTRISCEEAATKEPETAQSRSIPEPLEKNPSQSTTLIPEEPYSRNNRELHEPEQDQPASRSLPQNEQDEHLDLEPEMVSSDDESEIPAQQRMEATEENVGVEYEPADDEAIPVNSEGMMFGSQWQDLDPEQDENMEEEFKITDAIHKSPACVVEEATASASHNVDDHTYRPKDVYPPMPRSGQQGNEIFYQIDREENENPFQSRSNPQIRHQKLADKEEVTETSSENVVECSAEYLEKMKPQDSVAAVPDEDDNMQEAKVPLQCVSRGTAEAALVDSSMEPSRASHPGSRNVLRFWIFICLVVFTSIYFAPNMGGREAELKLVEPILVGDESPIFSPGIDPTHLRQNSSTDEESTNDDAAERTSSWFWWPKPSQVTEELGIPHSEEESLLPLESINETATANDISSSWLWRLWKSASDKIVVDVVSNDIPEDQSFDQREDTFTKVKIENIETNTASDASKKRSRWFWRSRDASEYESGLDNASLEYPDSITEGTGPLKRQDNEEVADERHSKVSWFGSLWSFNGAASENDVHVTGEQESFPLNVGEEVTGQETSFGNEPEGHLETTSETLGESKIVDHEMQAALDDTADAEDTKQLAEQQELSTENESLDAKDESLETGIEAKDKMDSIGMESKPLKTSFVESESYIPERLVRTLRNDSRWYWQSLLFGSSESSVSNGGSEESDNEPKRQEHWFWQRLMRRATKERESPKLIEFHEKVEETLSDNIIAPKPSQTVNDFDGVMDLDPNNEYHGLSPSNSEGSISIREPLHESHRFGLDVDLDIGDDFDVGSARPKAGHNLEKRSEEHDRVSDSRKEHISWSSSAWTLAGSTAEYLSQFFPSAVSNSGDNEWDLKDSMEDSIKSRMGSFVPREGNQGDDGDINQFVPGEMTENEQQKGQIEEATETIKINEIEKEMAGEDHPPVEQSTRSVEMGRDVMAAVSERSSIFDATSHADEPAEAAREERPQSLSGFVNSWSQYAKDILYRMKVLTADSRKGDACNIIDRAHEGDLGRMSGLNGIRLDLLSVSDSSTALDTCSSEDGDTTMSDERQMDANSMQRNWERMVLSWTDYARNAMNPRSVPIKSKGENCNRKVSEMPILETKDDSERQVETVEHMKAPRQVAEIKTEGVDDMMSLDTASSSTADNIGVAESGKPDKDSYFERGKRFLSAWAGYARNDLSHASETQKEEENVEHIDLLINYDDDASKLNSTEPASILVDEPPAQPLGAESKLASGLELESEPQEVEVQLEAEPESEPEPGYEPEAKDQPVAGPYYENDEHKQETAVVGNSLDQQIYEEESITTRYGTSKEQTIAESLAAVKTKSGTGELLKNAIVKWYNSGFALESVLLVGGAMVYWRKK